MAFKSRRASCLPIARRADAVVVALATGRGELKGILKERRGGGLV